MFQIKQISEHGTSNPIVARLSIQTKKLLDMCNLENEKKIAVFELYNNLVQKRLLECDDLSQELAKETLEIIDNINKNGFATQANGRVIHVPQIMRLEERIERFLYTGKSTLRDLAKIFNIFFNKEFGEAKYHLIHDWVSKTFNENCELAQLIKTDHDLWIKRMISMRNAIEHPGGGSGILHIHNFEFNEKLIKMEEPSWNLNNDLKSSLMHDLHTFITNMLEFSEELLLICIKMNKISDHVEFVEIPEINRNPNCPIRMMATFKLPKNN